MVFFFLVQLRPHHSHRDSLLIVNLPSALLTTLARVLIPYWTKLSQIIKPWPGLDLARFYHPYPDILTEQFALW